MEQSSTIHTINSIKYCACLIKHALSQGKTITISNKLHLELSYLSYSKVKESVKIVECLGMKQIHVL